MAKCFGTWLTISAAMVALVLILPGRFGPDQSAAGAGGPTCESLNGMTFAPTNHEQHWTCTQPGPDGFIGAWGGGIPIEFARPASMSQREFGRIFALGFKGLCAKAEILPADGISLPRGMTQAQFQKANRDGTLSLSPCAKPHMRWP